MCIDIRIIVLLACVLACAPAWAQREGENWYFGERAGVNFATGEAVPLLDGEMNTREGCITVSDTNGVLLFYSDGSSVWTKDHTIMANGTGLRGNSSSTQSCIVVPWPNVQGDRRAHDLLVKLKECTGASAQARC